MQYDLSGLLGPIVKWHLRHVWHHHNGSSECLGQLKLMKSNGSQYYSPSIAQKTVWKKKTWWDSILVCKWWNKGKGSTEMRGQANLKQWLKPKVIGAPNIEMGWMICGPATFECLWMIMVVQLLSAKLHRLEILTWFDDPTTRISLTNQNKLSHNYRQQ